MDNVSRVELEEGFKDTENKENLRLQLDKLRHSHPYDGLFLSRFLDCVVSSIPEDPARGFIFVGSGTGNDAAYICKRVGHRRAIVTDLSVDFLRHHKAVFSNYGVPEPDLAVACDFKSLPFSERAKEYWLIGFLCFHHSVSMEETLSDILEHFDSIVIFEPMTNPVLELLAKFNLSRRSENDYYRPSRVTASLIAKLTSKFDVKKKLFLQLPRDYLPFLSKKQKVTFDPEHMRMEKALSYFYFSMQQCLGAILSVFGFGNMVLLRLQKRT